MEKTVNPQLIRGLRRWDLLALVVNMTIGAGIFGLPGKIFALTGSYSLLAYGLCALLTILIILCFAEVGSRFSNTGGPYLYARTAFGPFVGFQVGWLMWLARVTAFAALCNLLTDYAGYFWPGLGAGIGRTSCITGVVFLLACVNLLGIRQSAFVGNVFTVGKLLPLFIFVSVGIFYIHPENYSGVTIPEYSAFSKTVMLLIFAFSGFEMAVIPAGESKDPRRHLPFALLMAITCVAILYILIQVVCIGTLPGLSTSSKPLADAGRIFLGPTGATLITLGALVSITGTLNAIMMAGPRLLFAVSENRQLPEFLSQVHARFKTPHFAILITAGFSWILAISGTFIYSATLSTLIKLLTFIATCAALPVLRRKPGIEPASFIIPGGKWIGFAALGLCVWLLTSCNFKEIRDLFIALTMGILIHVYVSRPLFKSRRSHL